MARVSSQSPLSFSASDYMNHLVGLVALLGWKGRWEEISYLSPFVSLRGPMLELGLVASQRFVVGFPATSRSRYGKTPFLCTQPEETQFFRRLSWARAYVSPPTRQLILVTNKVLGDGDTLEDLPAMGVSIEFDEPKKLELLARARGLDLRTLWFDEDGHHVGSGRPLASMPLRLLTPGESPFPQGALKQARSLREMIGDKLERTNRLYQEFVPGSGGAPVVPKEFQDIVQSFDAASVPQVRPR